MGFEKCLELALEVQPDMLVNPHWGSIRFSAEYARQALDSLRRREELYGRLLPYDNANFGLDPSWIHAYPYRQHALPGTRVEVEVRMMNHAATPKQARAILNLPQAWTPVTASAEHRIPPRTEARVRLSAMAPKAPTRRHQVLGISAVVGGKPLGEFAETIIDFLA